MMKRQISCAICKPSGGLQLAGGYTAFGGHAVRVGEFEPG
jgi:hypothetical protein